MISIEIIRIRLAPGHIERFKAKIAQMTNEVASPILTVYQHASITSDFSIHLTNDSVSPHASKSALHWIADLKELGLVNHSIWVRLDSTQSCQRGDYNDS